MDYQVWMLTKYIKPFCHPVPHRQSHRSSLIWACTVWPDLPVRKLTIITVYTVCHSFNIILLHWYMLKQPWPSGWFQQQFQASQYLTILGYSNELIISVQLYCLYILAHQEIYTISNAFTHAIMLTIKLGCCSSFRLFINPTLRTIPSPEMLLKGH